MSTPIVYYSYAKLNLYLDVLGRRRDGYHNIETIFQSVSLRDTLRFTEARSGISLECSTPELDTGEGNLAYRAAALLQNWTGCARGALIQIEKSIPIAAGLAGGSGDAATTLVALNHLWDLHLPAGHIRRLAFELGSDVPYCTIGGTMAATRRGEEMAALAPLPRTWFVLIHPSIAVSTSRVYNSPDLTYSGEKPFAGRTRSFRAAVRALAQGNPGLAVFNRMEGPVFKDHPSLAAAKQRLLDAGCLAAAMSGSGPTIFGVCRTKSQAAKIAEALRDAPPDCRMSVVSNVPVGVERVQ
ncbi:MAG: 4-(cytidine 5'-diphospho)-2-C-methyl-D-erythritol kinase [Candidatus Hydrogenedentes bacterium]|nr:4-(cytidine 5'-diphospho)-2-C-methyl-D-erythritol kinase [Candidatus Hydrogenedentota bacterium]